MRYSEAKSKLEGYGCEELPKRGKGSHRMWHNPENGKMGMLPYHGSKDIYVKWLSKCVKSLGIDWDEFND